MNGSGLNMETGRAPDAVEQSRLGRRHPHLPSGFEAAEEGHPAFLVEMRRNFIQKQDRRLAAPFRHQVGMCED
jgi:hypothetical protein